MPLPDLLRKLTRPDSGPGTRLPPWLAALALLCALASCKSLPEVEPVAPAKTVPTIETTRGALPLKQASALASKRWSNASAS